jgi:hypothetical protein
MSCVGSVVRRQGLAVSIGPNWFDFPPKYGDRVQSPKLKKKKTKKNSGTMNNFHKISNCINNCSQEALFSLRGVLSLRNGTWIMSKESILFCLDLRFSQRWL